MTKEQILIQRIKAHDDDALRTVYETNRQAFIDFSARFPINREDVLDIYQDAVVVFCEHIRKGRLDNLQSTISTYIFAIGKYKIYALLKKEKREVSIDEIGHEYPDLVPEPDEPIENMQILRQAFLTLGDKCRQVLTLFYYEEKKLDEIQEIMGYESKDVLKSQKSRCLKKLKDLSSRK